MEDVVKATDSRGLDKWDYRFLDSAKQVASWSKDPRSQLGAVAVIDRREISRGYNGFPQGIYDSYTRLNDRDTKLKYVVHAEMNCIYNAARHGVSLVGATLYVDGIATCSECAKGVIQSGIKRVVMRYKPMKSGWAESFELTKSMFREVGMEYACVEVSESPVRGDEPSGQTDSGNEAERNIQAAVGVGRRHRSADDFVRQHDTGTWPGEDALGPMRSPPSRYL